MATTSGESTVSALLLEVGCQRDHYSAVVAAERQGSPARRNGTGWTNEYLCAASGATASYAALTSHGTSRPPNARGTALGTRADLHATLQGEPASAIRVPQADRLQPMRPGPAPSP